MRKILVVSCCLLAFGCGPTGLTARSEAASPVRDWGHVVDYSNGVLFFPYTGEEFGQRLSLYLKSHPHMRVTAMVDSPQEGPYNFNKGYFVTVEER